MSIMVKGAREVIDALQNAERIIDHAGTRYLGELGMWTTDRARHYTEAAGAVDLGNLIDSIGFKTRRTTHGLETKIGPSGIADKYAIYVERGTRPHWPPIEKLRGWAERHGIPVYAVAYKISREGTDPRWIFRDTFDDLDPHIDNTIPGFAQMIVRRVWG